MPFYALELKTEKQLLKTLALSNKILVGKVSTFSKHSKFFYESKRGWFQDGYSALVLNVLLTSISKSQNTLQDFPTLQF